MKPVHAPAHHHLSSHAVEISGETFSSRFMTAASRSPPMTFTAGQTTVAGALVPVLLQAPRSNSSSPPTLSPPIARSSRSLPPKATPSPSILISPSSADGFSFHWLPTFAWFSLFISFARCPPSPYTPREVRFMQHPMRIFTSLLLSLCLTFLSGAAFDSPLSDSAIREAYFLGLRHDDKTRVTLEQYSRRLPVPQKGAHVAEIGLYTPYAQIVQQTSEKMIASSAQQAAEDFHKQKETIQVRLLILLTPTYSS